MQEQIRYAWGVSSLGEFIAAVSGVGLLAFEFGENRTAMLNARESRLPGASVVNDQDGLAGTVERLKCIVDYPKQDAAIALDMRGSDYQKKVWNMLLEIPAGETTSYGALAAKLGTSDARDVTEAIGSNTIAILIPCHRVIKKDGSISGYRWGVRRKRSLLGREQHNHSPWRDLMI
ncbi:methylated-DNA--[protein]-cysteine S-methyltransferase [Tardiphaga sp.]|uniref:methylated-DNA--[protein]-cysteine S-methyltransferase n=1 Tax=Tardiphaga sp. TaxID=1926292 RepID=UPI0026086421|nr:methylated-DNA--[protein]-cysteine S-methyltransferase [Tardiphaga sp.]MDB5620390.1 cysteine methyltransferase [Tardiphaga sp.]